MAEMDYDLKPMLIGRTTAVRSGIGGRFAGPRKQEIMCILIASSYLTYAYIYINIAIQWKQGGTFRAGN